MIAGDFDYKVPKVTQVDDDSCWAAGIEAMIRYSGQKVTQKEIHDISGIPGQIPLNTRSHVERVFKYFDMRLKPFRLYSADQIWQTAVLYGPLWVGIDFGGPLWEAFKKGTSPNHNLVLKGGEYAADESEDAKITFELMDPGVGGMIAMEATTLIKKMDRLGVKTKSWGHWIGHFNKNP